MVAPATGGLRPAADEAGRRGRRGRRGGVEPLPDPDGIERRGGETWVSGGEWVVSGLGFGGEWGLRGHGVGRPVGPWGGLVASWATRPSGGGSVVSSPFFSFVFFYFLLFSFFPFCYYLC